MATQGINQRFNSLRVENRHANLDYWYGPYTTKEEANVMTEGVRDIGFTVGIKEFIKNDNGEYIYTTLVDEFSGVSYHAYVESDSQELQKYSFIGIEEYQYKRDINNLEKKGESSLILQLISPDRIRTSENIPIKIQILGGITPNSIQVYEVVDEQEFLTNYSYPGVIPLNGEISLNLNLTGNPRTIVYRIKVTDKNNQYAKTIDDQNYVEITIDFKEIAIYNLNTNSIDSLVIKNSNNLQGRSFSFNIGYITFIQDYDISLYIGNTLINNVIEILGPDYYKVTLPDNLTGFGGEDVKIQLQYTRLEETGETTTGEIQYTIVTIMGKGVFANISTEIPGNIFYIGNKAACRIYFEAESQETYSISSYDRPDDPNEIDPNIQYSDFSYNGRIMAYQWNTIYINPENITNNPKFIFLIENTKQVIVNTIEGSSIKNFTKSIFSDGIRTPQDPRTFDNSYGKVKSFILDINCFINWTNSNDPLFSIGGISINRELISFGYIAYPTPLQRDIHIGFEFQVRDDDSDQIIEGRTIYNALYIDGVLCKNLKIEESKQELGVFVNNIQYSNDFIIKDINIYTSTTSNLYPFTYINFKGSDKFIPIIQNNYEFYNQKEDDSLDLPTLSLTALDLDNELYELRNTILTKNGTKPDKAIIPSKFGTLQDAKVKYESNIDASTGSYNILLKQRMSLKKALQKSRGVLCYYQYGDDPNNKGYVEVHTQGTSTLDYRLPNFKFTFLNNDMTNKKVDLVDGYNESVLTAKADYMDSSHLNNTPTATYYNKIIHSGFFQEDGQDYRSPSAKLGGLDAITGIPIIMSIKDVDQNEFVNYGSFMLNVDKTGDALKFKVDDDIDECISFEGTSNAFDSGFSSRFEIESRVENDFELINTSLEDQNIEESQFYSEIYEKNYIIRKSDLSLQQNKPILRSMVNVLNYLAEGLEYRYPDGDIIEESKNKEYYIIMPFSHFKRLFKMFYWVANSSLLSESDYKSQFVQYFNYDYCALYFINLMVFGQTDNLGKNCMFDQWFDPNGENNDKDCLWYPRPYDLDSQTGLDNNGNDAIAPFVEISPRFSLNYQDVVNSWDGTGELYNYLEEYKLTPDSTLIYPQSMVENLEGIAKRYSFSSSNSNLWFNFYKNFKNEIRETYTKLRKYKVNESFEYDSRGKYSLLSYDSIINFYKSFVLDKLGNSQYNLDFQLKYLGDVDDTGLSRQFFGLGNRWNAFKDWMKKRIQFCDIYFRSREFRVELSIFNKELLLNSPQYVITRYDQPNAVDTVHFFDGVNKINIQISGNGTSSSGLKYAFWINPEAILEGNIYNNLTTSAPPMPLDSIVTLDVGGKVLSNVIDITNASYLQTLRINSLESSYNSPLPKNIKNIIIENSRAFPSISDLPYLQSITIKDCNTNNGTLLLENLGDKQHPIILTIENSQLSLDIQNVSIRQFTSTNNIINNLSVNNVVCPKLELRNQTIGTIGFSGNSSDIKIIDFRKSDFLNDTLNLSVVAESIEHLLLNDTTGLVTIKSSNKFTSLKFLGLMNSDIQNFVYDKEDENRNLDHFDGKLLPNNLPKVLYCQNYTEVLTLSSEQYIAPIEYNSTENDYYSGTTLASRGFNLEQTSIVNVINLNILDFSIVGNNGYNCSGVTQLFTNCQNLQSISNSTIKCSGFKMFKNCSNLKSIDNTTIKIGTDATQMFATCNNLFYNDYIEPILNNNTQITNFTKFLYNTAFCHIDSNQQQANVIIDLSKYSSATILDYAFGIHTYSERGFIPSQKEGITIQFTNTLPVSLTSMQHTFDLHGNYGTFANWNNLIKNCSNLTQMNYAFYTCKSGNNTFYTISTSWLPDSEYLDLECAFANCNIKLSNGFKFKSNVRSCKNTFEKCITSDNYTFDVKNIFEDCDKLECVSRCFYDNQWATTSDTMIFNDNVPKEIIIAGLFGTDTAINNNNNYPEVFGQIYGKYTLTNQNMTYGSSNERSYRYNPPGSSNITPQGAFYRRKVKLYDNTSVTYTSSNLQQLFREAKITLYKANESDELVNKLHIDLNSPNINYVLYNTDIGGAKLSVDLNNTINANYAFQIDNVNKYSFQSEIVDNVDTGIINPPELPNTIKQATNMFYNQSINTIPIDYFKYNNNFIQITNIYGMFRKTRITKLPFNQTYGLIPDSVTNLNYLFADCYNLRGGIPNNLFNSNTVLKEMKGTFYRTGVLFEINSDDITIMTPLDLSEQTSNVKDVTQLFYYNYVQTSNNTQQQIMYDCFKNCTTLNQLFENSKELIYRNSTYKLVKINSDNNAIEITSDFKINSPINLNRTFVGFEKKLSLETDTLDELKDIKGIVHAVTSNNNVSSSTNNDIDEMIYDLISSLLTKYSNFENVKNKVGLDRCLGKWQKNNSKLSLLDISSDNDYRVINYWYNPDTSISTSRGYPSF